MSESETRRDVGGMIVAATLILLGTAMLWDTTRMIDRDSYVFPRAIIGLMMVLCLVVIVRAMLRRPRPSAEEKGSMPRRVALVAVMLAGTLAMPAIGFAASGVVVFGALTLIAMYDPWTRFRLIVYPLVGLAVSLGFYILFKRVLLVPFPEGTFFG